jgi:hypothetical protein
MSPGSEVRSSSVPNSLLQAIEPPPPYTIGSLRQTHPFLIPSTQKTAEASNQLTKSAVTRSFEDKGHVFSFINTASGQTLVATDTGQTILKTGIPLGFGHERFVELSVLTSSEQKEKLVVSSKQVIERQKRSDFAEQEIKILKKIQDLVKNNSDLKKLVYKLIWEYSSPVEKQLYQVVNTSSDTYVSHETGYKKRVVKNGFPVREQTLICKYYNGGTLKDRMPFLTRKERFLVADCLLKFLNFLHLNRIFHSDLKSNNILLKVETQIIEDEEVDVTVAAIIGDYELSCDLNDENDCFYKDGCGFILSEEFKERLKEFEFTSSKDNQSEKTLQPEKSSLEGTKILEEGVDKKGMPIDESVLKEDVFAMGLILKELFENEDSSFIQELIREALNPKAKDRPSTSEVYNKFLALDIFQTDFDDEKDFILKESGELFMFGEPDLES